MPTLHVLRVFTDAAGKGGNALGVFLEGEQIAPEQRQQYATELGFSETVYVDDAASGELRIFIPARAAARRSSARRRLVSVRMRRPGRLRFSSRSGSVGP